MPVIVVAALSNDLKPAIEAQRLSNELDAIRFDAEHDPDPT